MFSDFDFFQLTLKEVYGEPNEKEKAIRKLLNLRIKRNYPEYLAMFLQLAPRVGQDDGALVATFYKGLLDEIKDKIARSEKPKTT